MGCTPGKEAKKAEELGGGDKDQNPPPGDAQAEEAKSAETVEGAGEAGGDAKQEESPSQTAAPDAAVEEAAEPAEKAEEPEEAAEEATKPAEEAEEEEVVEETKPAEVAEETKPAEVAEETAEPAAEPVAEPAPAKPQTPTKTTPEPGTPREDFEQVAWAKKSPMGLYLKYLPKDGGTFLAVWSKTFAEGALAYARPSDFYDVPEYKFKKSITVQARVDMGKQSYYQAWCQFVKEAKGANAELVLLPNTEHTNAPSLVIWLLSGESITKVVEGSPPPKLKFADIVTACGASFIGFNDERKSGCTKQKFLSLGRTCQDSFTIAFAQ